MSKLFTRKEIIEVWQKNKVSQDCFCCPDCRDILTEVFDNDLICENFKCTNKAVYKISEIERIQL